MEHEISHFGGLKANELLPVAVTDASTCWSLLKDKPIRIIFIALWFSTLAIAALEPTLPVWLIETVDPPVIPPVFHSSHKLTNLTSDIKFFRNGNSA